MAEDDRPVANVVQQPLVVLPRLGVEALDVGERRAVHEENPVELGPRRQCVEPVHELLGVRAGEELVGLHHLRAVERRIAEPPLAVAADPGRVRQLAQARDRLLGPRARGPVVAAEQPTVDAELGGIIEHAPERRDVAVDVVEHREHCR